MSEELLPCPFCGGEATFKSSVFNGEDKKSLGNVHCLKCYSSTGGDLQIYEQSIKGWNTRPAASVECGGERINLLPCPFCGGEVELIQVSRPAGIWEIHCFNDNCHAGCGQPDKEAVIEAWNTRPSTSVPRVKDNEPKWPEKLNIDANGSRDLVLMNTGYNDAIDRCIKAWKDAQGFGRTGKEIKDFA